MPTVARILQLAPTCCRLADEYARKKSLFGGGSPAAKNQATLIYAGYTILNKFYEEDPTYELQAEANYLYELMMKFAFKAANIVDGGGGGQIAPITPTVRPDQLNFTVAASGTPLIDGDTTKTFSGFIGYELVVVKNSQPLDQITTKPVYYLWNRDTGIFFINQATITDDEWQITPV